VRLETEINIAETLREVHLVGKISFASRANRLLRRGRVSISIELRISLPARLLRYINKRFRYVNRVMSIECGGERAQRGNVFGFPARRAIRG